MQNINKICLLHLIHQLLSILIFHLKIQFKSSRKVDKILLINPSFNQFIVIHLISEFYITIYKYCLLE